VGIDAPRRPSSVPRRCEGSRRLVPEHQMESRTEIPPEDDVCRGRPVGGLNAVFLNHGSATALAALARQDRIDLRGGLGLERGQHMRVRVQREADLRMRLSGNPREAQNMRGLQRSAVRSAAIPAKTTDSSEPAMPETHSRRRRRCRSYGVPRQQSIRLVKGLRTGVMLPRPSNPSSDRRGRRSWTRIISHTVSQRRHELGIRMALGAAAPDVMRMVLVQGLKLASLGTVIGLMASFGAAR
jgi:hypothetical protein